MSNSQSVVLDPFLLDLFQELRKAGMALTLEQYELLQKAVAQGYGLGGWQDLQRVCRLLWVKPCANYDAKVFNLTFDRYIQQHHHQMPVLSPPIDKPPEPPKSNLPKIPPRWNLSPQKSGEVKVPVAAQTSPDSRKFPNTRNNFHLRPTDFPIQLHDVQVTWRLLRQVEQVGLADELDMEATLARIEREGNFSDLVMRPMPIRLAELLLLVDDNSAMIPFFPALQPFIEAIASSRIKPARIYQFTSYPDEYLYHWHHPSQAEPLTQLLPKLHRNRTITLIFSDAGAATATYSQERIQGISKFLTVLSLCTRQIIWLNPQPPERWEQTSAWAINAMLNGKMVTYQPASLQRATREIPQGSKIKTWQI